MLETICKEIVTKNTFLFHFMDKDLEELTLDQSDALRKFKTVDGSQHKMALRTNAMPKAVLIDLKIIYPRDFYHPNVYELLDLNEIMFQSFYSDEMGYNKTNKYANIAETNTSIGGK